MQEKLCVYQDFFGCNLNSFAKNSKKENQTPLWNLIFSNKPAICLNIIV